MSLSVTILEPSDNTTETDYTAGLRPEKGFELGGQAFNGDADGDGNFWIDDDAGTIAPLDDIAKGKRIFIEEDASGSPQALFVGRVGTRQWKRPGRKADKARSIDVAVVDANHDLAGIVVDRYPRPEEEPHVRVAAVLADFLNGTASLWPNPDDATYGIWGRPSTVIGDAYVNTADLGVLMPATTYNETDPRSVLRECAEWAGYDVFVIANPDRTLDLFFDEPTSTAYTSTLSISDNITQVNDTTVFAPWWIRGPSRENVGTDQGSAVLVVGGDESRTYFQKGTTVTDTNDKFEFVERTDATAQADLNSLAVAHANRRQQEATTINCVIAVAADSVHLIRPGMRVEVKRAYAAAIGTSTYFRAFQVRYSYRTPETYWVALQLGYPIKLVRRRGGPRAPRLPIAPLLLATQGAIQGGGVGTGITIPSGLTDSAMLIAIAAGPFITWPASSVKWVVGATEQTATLVGSVTHDTEGGIALYRVLDPTPATITGSVVVSGGELPPMGVWVYSGVNQTTPVSGFTASATNASGGTATISGTATEAQTPIAAVYAQETDFALDSVADPTTGAGMTEDWSNSHQFGTPGFTDAEFAGGHGDATPSWTFDETHPYSAFVAMVNGTPGDEMGSVGGTGEGAAGTPGVYIPVGSVLEHQNITTGGPYHEAADVTLADAGGYFTGTTVEAALQEAGADIAALGGTANLDDLGDVTITSPATADRLRFDGSGWRNSALIWRPVMTYDGTNWLVLVDGDGNAIMAEA